ncbi:hypothetical protein [uncultured Rikenella sp.]|uniref:hypothetical protein n=1 Tax=uncultured Rikenella sp. TaxID=368003 RepID=UPI0025D9A321|nr:hypothetical protein [uncultured Rikenella sp.]
MARTIAEIKESITTDFMRNEDVAALYGFAPGDAFTTHFSRVSIENLFFYIVACATWVLEQLFDRHRTDIENRIDTIMPHRPKWYRDKTLAFMQNRLLLPDTDRYDTAGMDENEIEAARVVKFAAAMENTDSSLLTIKVAGEKEGVRQPLDADTEKQLAAYIAETKDAGVRINLVNRSADIFHCKVDIYYDPILLSEEVENRCREAIRNYVENLPFNGEYTHMALVDELQKVEGTRIVELISASAEGSDDSVPIVIDTRFTPSAGYFTAGEIILNMQSYK